MDAERACLREFGGGCQIPMGAFATHRGELLHLESVVAAVDGSLVIRFAADGSDPVALGKTVAAGLIKLGAHEVLR